MTKTNTLEVSTNSKNGSILQNLPASEVEASRSILPATTTRSHRYKGMPEINDRELLVAATQYWKWANRWGRRDKPIAPLGDHEWLESWMDEHKHMLSAIYQSGSAIAAVFLPMVPMVHWMALDCPVLRQSGACIETDDGEDQLLSDFLDERQLCGTVRVSRMLEDNPYHHIIFREAGIAALGKALWDSKLHIDRWDLGMIFRDSGMGNYLEILDVKKSRHLEPTLLTKHREILRRLIRTQWQTIVDLAALLLKHGFLDYQTILGFCVECDPKLKQKLDVLAAPFTKQQARSTPVNP